MEKEKESGTLLGVGNKYLQAKEIKGEFYVKASDFNRCMDGIRIEQEADRKHIEELEEEIKKLRAAATMYRNDCKKLRAENEYLHKLLPEADGYIIEKQMKKRLWNDGEEDVYD